MPKGKCIYLYYQLISMCLKSHGIHGNRITYGYLGKIVLLVLFSIVTYDALWNTWMINYYSRKTKCGFTLY